MKIRTRRGATRGIANPHSKPTRKRVGTCTPSTSCTSSGPAKKHAPPRMPTESPKALATRSARPDDVDREREIMVVMCNRHTGSVNPKGTEKKPMLSSVCARLP